ncbi:MAG: DNA translocase FtsK, partial [Bacteroidota bacterium]|nr:DNA translocase FtsK [Bacteroidota bacterium]
VGVLALLAAVFAGALRGVPGFAHLPLEWSGAVGAFIATLGRQLLGTAGMLLLTGTAFGALLVVEFPWIGEHLVRRGRLRWGRFRDWWARQRSQAQPRGGVPTQEESTPMEVPEPARIVRVTVREPAVSQPGSPTAPQREQQEGTTHSRSSSTPAQSKSRSESLGSQQVSGELHSRSSAEELPGYSPPPPALLTPGSEVPAVDAEELRQNAHLLQEKLETFRIGIENLTVTPGPVVTQYEFVPAAGVKISQIESLADDIALALKAPGVRIIAPVPGRGTVAVEIPNHRRALVRFRSIVESPLFWQSDSALPLGLGKTITGEVYCADLARMPHLLIAGATGSGKSVGLNTMLLSLLFRLCPSELKLVIIDPKKVELTHYAMLERHFLAFSPDVGEPVVTSPSAAVLALRAVELEMERRYDLLAQTGQRNIVDYNRRVREGKLESHFQRLPYIVVVVDELADLMLTAARAVEGPITRLAQLARAVGIHLLVATQRPSVDVITGLIKANFPARIAYQVASRVDSRVILDMPGAEQLLGNGDMLFLPGGVPKPIRLQNAYVSAEEVEAVCAYIAQQPGYEEPYLLPEASGQGEAKAEGGPGGRDPLFAEAARLVVRHQQGSVSLLQRRLKIGYSRAARIMDELEAAGIVGPTDGSRARQVLIHSEADLGGIL